MNTNLTKVWTFIIVTGLLFLVIGYQLGDRLGLLIGFFAAVALNILIFFFGDDRMLNLLQAKELRGQDGYGLLEKVRHFSNRLHMRTPRVFVFPSKVATTFCIGHSWRNGTVVFSTALLDKFSGDELNAIISHQLCRIESWDTFGYSVSSTLANTVVGFGEWLDRFLPFELFKPTLSPIGWLIIKLIVRERALYENDLRAASLVDNRFALGKALWKLDGFAQVDPLTIPPCTSHLFIVNPEGFAQRNIFLKSHPPMEKRLNKLMGYFPP